MANTIFSCVCQEDPITKELFIELPIELLESMQWFEGDRLSFSSNSPSSFILRKLKNESSQENLQDPREGSCSD